MDEQAYRKYEAESTGWLHRGRTELLRGLLDIAASGSSTRLLEVGAGVGQNLDSLRSYGTVDAAEIDPIGQERITARGVAEQLYTDPIPFQIDAPYDVICALDVIEHLEDDAEAVRWMVSNLRRGGHLVITVPAYQWMFADHDRALGHYRRYTRRSLRAVLPQDVEVVRLGYFNTVLFPAAAAARLFSKLRGRLRPRTDTPTKQSSSVPRPLDAALHQVLRREAKVFARRPIAPFGLSVALLARRRPDA